VGSFSHLVFDVRGVPETLVTAGVGLAAAVIQFGGFHADRMEPAVTVKAA
jgi:hypothetical protein